MEENFKEGNKEYKGKRSVNDKISENIENIKVLIVNYIKYSGKIVNKDKLWVLWCERQRPRGRKTKTSNIIVINKASGRQSNIINIKNKNNKSVKKNLERFKVKNVNRTAVNSIGAHSKVKSKTKEFVKNNPDLIRIFQAYPAYIRGLGIISPQIGYFRLILPNLGSLGYLRKIKPVLIRIFQAYPAYIKDIRVGSNIPTQIGYFRLSLPIGI